MFVCYGNICRSPMAEYIFKYLTHDKYNITSRATSTDEIGHDIYPPAKEVLDKNNIPYSKHHASQITQSDYDTYDIIVCFDTLNYDTLRRRFNDNNNQLFTDILSYIVLLSLIICTLIDIHLIRITYVIG